MPTKFKKYVFSIDENWKEFSSLSEARDIEKQKQREEKAQLIRDYNNRLTPYHVLMLYGAAAFGLNFVSTLTAPAIVENQEEEPSGFVANVVSYSLFATSFAFWTVFMACAVKNFHAIRRYTTRMEEIADSQYENDESIEAEFLRKKLCNENIKEFLLSELLELGEDKKFTHLNGNLSVDETMLFHECDSGAKLLIDMLELVESNTLGNQQLFRNFLPDSFNLENSAKLLIEAYLSKEARAGFVYCDGEELFDKILARLREISILLAPVEYPNLPNLEGNFYPFPEIISASQEASAAAAREILVVRGEYTGRYSPAQSIDSLTFDDIFNSGDFRPVPIESDSSCEGVRLVPEGACSSFTKCVSFRSDIKIDTEHKTMNPISKIQAQHNPYTRSRLQSINAEWEKLPLKRR